jgi:hypothetical protein
MALAAASFYLPPFSPVPQKKNIIHSLSIFLVLLRAQDPMKQLHLPSYSFCSKLHAPVDGSLDVFLLSFLCE